MHALLALVLPPVQGESVFDRDQAMAKRTMVMPPLPEDRFLCSFSHIFAGGYSAGWVHSRRGGSAASGGGRWRAGGLAMRCGMMFLPPLKRLLYAVVMLSRHAHHCPTRFSTTPVQLLLLQVCRGPQCW